ncbi:hypothetical protein G6514_005638 [Epicoccum nigrum]|nr:hypothetical protein G6514_005638 [Epicoccum nigrum]
MEAFSGQEGSAVKPSKHGLESFNAATLVLIRKTPLPDIFLLIAETPNLRSTLLHSFLTLFLVDAIAAQSNDMADREESDGEQEVMLHMHNRLAETMQRDRESNRQQYVVETQQMLDNQKRDSFHEISGCITKEAVSTKSTVRAAQANIIDNITSTHAFTKKDILAKITAEATIVKTCVEEGKAELLADSNVKAIDTKAAVQKSTAEIRADVAKEANLTQDAIIERVSRHMVDLSKDVAGVRAFQAEMRDAQEAKMDMLFAKTTEIHRDLRKIAADNDKRKLQPDSNETAEEPDRSRRRRVEQPVDHHLLHSKRQGGEM